MSTVFIFHGTGGHPGENWFPWLKEKLEAAGHSAIVPKFPTPEGQSLQSWLAVFDKYKDKVDEQTIFVAHSLGCIFLLRVLEKLPHLVRAAIFVSAPVGVEPIKNYAGDKAFSDGFDFDWQNIKAKALQFLVFHSDDDPYISLGNGEKLAKELAIPLTFIPHAGHFNAKAGFTIFPQLLQKLGPYLDKFDTGV